MRARKDDHRKYVGLVEFRPKLLWVIGPDAFANELDELSETLGDLFRAAAR